MAFRRKKTAPAPAPAPPAAPSPKHRPWLVYILLIIGALVGAQYFGCPVLTESESIEWVE